MATQNSVTTIIDALQPTRFFGNTFDAFRIKTNLINIPLHPQPIFTILLGVFVLGAFLLLVRLIYRNKKSANEKYVLLEITPPDYSEKTAYTTQQLFSTIYGLGERRTLIDKILGKKKYFSFEIVSTKNQGIRYLIRITPNFVNNLKRNLLSYLPAGMIKEVSEYLPRDHQTSGSFKSKVVEYKLTKSFGFPLQKQEILEEHDPIGYVAGQMTKLSEGELISLQLVLSPAETKEANHISGKVRNQENVIDYLEEKRPPLILDIVLSVLKIFAKVLAEVISEFLKAFQEMKLSDDPRSLERYRAYELEHKMRLNAPKPHRLLSPYEQEIINSIKEKVEQPLFNSAIRLFVIAKDKRELKERIDGFSASLRPFAYPGYQELRIKRSIFDLI